MPEHRRVEPRGIIGTGMAADPEYIEELIETAGRRARAERPPPKRKFLKVLQDVEKKPAKKEETPKP